MKLRQRMLCFAAGYFIVVSFLLATRVIIHPRPVQATAGISLALVLACLPRRRK